MTMLRTRVVIRMMPVSMSMPVCPVAPMIGVSVRRVGLKAQHPVGRERRVGYAHRESVLREGGVSAPSPSATAATAARIAT